MSCGSSPLISNAINSIRSTRLAAGLGNCSSQAGRLELSSFSRGCHEASITAFIYRRREAKGVQPPIETLRLGHESCRDFAMLMIDAARSFGLAARFASGYLAVPLDDPQEPTSSSGRGSTRCLGASLSARCWMD